MKIGMRFYIICFIISIITVFFSNINAKGGEYSDLIREEKRLRSILDGNVLRKTWKELIQSDKNEISSKLNKIIIKKNEYWIYIDSVTFYDLPSFDETKNGASQKNDIIIRCNERGSTVLPEQEDCDPTVTFDLSPSFILGTRENLTWQVIDKDYSREEKIGRIELSGDKFEDDRGELKGKMNTIKGSVKYVIHYHIEKKLFIW